MVDVKRVLVVEDSITAAKQLQAVIDGLDGFEVVGHAGNGAEGLKEYQRLKPDVVCMDIVMPVMGGLQALRGILNADAEAKVVMISSLGDVGDRAVEALKLGAKAVISKPFEAERISSTLQSL